MSSNETFISVRGPVVRGPVGVGALVWDLGSGSPYLPAELCSGADQCYHLVVPYHQPRFKFLRGSLLI